jgi:Domain of unknown function (DUF4296)
MRAWLIIIIISFLVTACKNKNKIPRHVIPQNKMQEVLWDMMRADQFLNEFILNRDSGLDKAAERVKMYNKVFSIHHISREQFNKSFRYYKDHPSIFKVMMDSISKPKIEIPAEIKYPSVINDSIKQNEKKLSDSVIPKRKKKLNLLN